MQPPAAHLHVVLLALVLSGLLGPFPLARGQNASACNPALYDRLALYANTTDPSLLQACEASLHPGCTSLQHPHCDTRFVPFDTEGWTSDPLGNFVSSCTECRAGWYLPLGATSMVCSANGGPGVPAGPYYYEQRVCRPCTTITGVCTLPGTTLEGCTLPGRNGDAQCVPCTNAPANAVYTGPSPGNLDQCPFACARGFYAVAVAAGVSGTVECRSCDTDPCQPGRYRFGCGADEDDQANGTCVPCTTALVANNADPGSYHYTTAGSPSDQDNCEYRCSANLVKLASGECLSIVGLDQTRCSLGFKLQFGDDCVACSGPDEVPPLNARYDQDDGSVPQKGGLCSWQCNPGHFRNANDQCQAHTLRNCTRGHFLASRGNATHDSLCAPCNMFPASMDALASYRAPPTDRGLQDVVAMCVWDCKVGYHKAEGDVPACVRCENKPMNARYIARTRAEPPADHNTKYVPARVPSCLS